MLRKSNIYLLRERTEFNIENLDTSYVFCNINLLKKHLIESIKKPHFKISNETILNDYLFICFLLGNDFIINSPSINIRYNGIKYLLDTYNTLQNEHFGRFFMTDKNKIDLNNFKLFIHKLSENENNSLDEIFKIRKKSTKKISKKNYLSIKNDISVSSLQTLTHKDLNMSEELFKDFKNHSPIILRINEAEIFQNKQILSLQFLQYNQ